MFLPFFEALRRAGVPVSPREFLTFLEALAADLVTYDVDGFYYLARAALVKDERHLDRFDGSWPRNTSARRRRPRSPRRAGSTS